MPNESVVYLSSLDSTRFLPVRRCRVVRHTRLETGRDVLLVEVSPAVVGQDFDRAADITELVVAARFEGSTVCPMTEFPLFVYIALPPEAYDRVAPLRVDDLLVIAWGELYRTEEDAREHRFKCAPAVRVLRGVVERLHASGEPYPNMPKVSSGWTQTSAYFKGEKSVINIGLGRGPALTVFNRGIVGFQVVGQR